MIFGAIDPDPNFAGYDAARRFAHCGAAYSAARLANALFSRTSPELFSPSAAKLVQGLIISAKNYSLQL